ncbi:MAG: hypothetical protein ACXWQQ_13395 [Pseudobdellovibrio sp.]
MKKWALAFIFVFSAVGVKAQTSALFFKIYEKEPGISSEQWSEAIESHVSRLKQNGLTSIKLDIEENKFVEYAQFKNNSEFLDAEFEEVSRLIYSQRK